MAVEDLSAGHMVVFFTSAYPWQGSRRSAKKNIP